MARYDKTAFSHGDVFASMFDSMLPEMGLRLVVQRTPIADECPDAEPEGIFGTEYIYRCIVSNDWDSTEHDIITYHNRRGASERNFDCQNNDFGWAHMPFSFLKENTCSSSPPPSSRTSTFTFLMSSANVSKDLTRPRGSSVSCACSSLCQRSGFNPGVETCSTSTLNGSSISNLSAEDPENAVFIRRRAPEHSFSFGVRHNFSK